MEGDELSQLAQDLLELRSHKKLSQQKLADALGVTQKLISDWENGKVVPNGAALTNLSRFFGKKITEDGIKGNKSGGGDIIVQVQKEVLESIIQHSQIGFQKNEATLQIMVAELQKDKGRAQNEKDVEVGERIKLQNDNRRLIELLSGYIKPPEDRK